MNPFGVVLQQRRVQEDLSMQELARRMNVAHSTISRWEHPDQPSEIRRDEVARVAAALNHDDAHPDKILTDIYILSLAAGYVPDAAMHFFFQPPIVLMAKEWPKLAHAGQQEVMEHLRTIMMEETNE